MCSIEQSVLALFLRTLAFVSLFSLLPSRLVPVSTRLALALCITISLASGLPGKSFSTLCLIEPQINFSMGLILKETVSGFIIALSVGIIGYAGSLLGSWSSKLVFAGFDDFQEKSGINSNLEHSVLTTFLILFFVYMFFQSIPPSAVAKIISGLSAPIISGASVSSSLYSFVANISSVSMSMALIFLVPIAVACLCVDFSAWMIHRLVKYSMTNSLTTSVRLCVVCLLFVVLFAVFAEDLASYVGKSAVVSVEHLSK